MRKKLQKITGKTIIGFLMVVAILAPVSLPFSVSTFTGGAHISAFEPLIAYAIGIPSSEDLVKYAIDALGYIMITVASFFTGVGGFLLDTTIEKLVLGMGALVNGNSLGSAINSSWSLIRDISNLAFIFGFIFIGIRTIIDPESAATKRFLAKIIVGALLINFSLFFVKVIIDAANFTSVKIYEAMVTGDGSIAETISNKLGIVTFFNIKNAEDLTAAMKGNGMTFYIMASIFMITAGFVFAASALMLIVRFVTLIFIMIGSPILFAATVFPQTEHYAQELWKKLLSSAFYAPIFLLLTFISITLIGSLNLGTGDLAAGIRQPAVDGNFGVVLQFIVIIFVMIQALLIANKSSLAGADMVTSKTKTLIGASTAGLAMRAGAYAGRNTAGRFANHVSDSEGLKDSASKKGWRGSLSRATLKGSRIVGDTSFDARNTFAGKGLSAGDGHKGGYATIKKEVEAKEEKFAKSLGEVGDTDARVADRKKEMEGAEKHVRELEEDLKAETDVAKKKAIREEIETAKHHVHEAKVKYETEKQRRIIGSTYHTPEATAALNEHNRKISELKKEIDTRATAFNGLPDGEAKEAQREIIANFNKALTEAQKAHDVLQRDSLAHGGYAGVLEQSSIVSNMVSKATKGHVQLVSHSQNAGKAIRKARKDGLPKEKGGHDDHGGHGDHKDDHGAHEAHAAPAAHAPAPKAAPAAHAPAAHAAPAGGGHDDHGHGHH